MGSNGLFKLSKPLKNALSALNAEMNTMMVGTLEDEPTPATLLGIRNRSDAAHRIVNYCNMLTMEHKKHSLIPEGVVSIITDFQQMGAENVDRNPVAHALSQFMQEHGPEMEKLKAQMEAKIAAAGELNAQAEETPQTVVMPDAPPALQQQPNQSGLQQS